MLKEYECLQCVDAIRDGFKTVDEMITKGEYATLAHDFKTCTDLTDKDDRFQVCAQNEIFIRCNVASNTNFYK